MAHGSQAVFFYWVRDKFPQYFKGVKVLDVGSLNVNGCNKILFSGCDYTGIDLGEGDNVDLVCIAHEHDAPDGHYDVIISSECFEHDMHIGKTLQNIVRMLRPGGLFVFSCAADNRDEHGTRKCDPEASPFTSKIDVWCDYYRGLNDKDMKEMLNFESIFEPCVFQLVDTDLYFYGIKKGVEKVKEASSESLGDFSNHNQVSRLIKTPHEIALCEIFGKERWFFVREGKLCPFDGGCGSYNVDDIKIIHQGEMVLKEDLGCMNTKTE